MILHGLFVYASNYVREIEFLGAFIKHVGGREKTRLENKLCHTWMKI